LDLWNKSNMPNKIERIKWAIDLNRGTVVHVRVLSPYLGKEWEKRFRKEYDAQMERWKRGEVESKPKPPKPHHSIVLIGYAGNQFLFWDPDAATTAVHVRPGGPPERGFGLLQYEASEQLLWAPAHRDHYRVVATWKGR
jgi:hypothetical protein